MYALAPSKTNFMALSYDEKLLSDKSEYLKLGGDIHWATDRNQFKRIIGIKSMQQKLYNKSFSIFSAPDEGLDCWLQSWILCAKLHMLPAGRV